MNLRLTFVKSYRLSIGVGTGIGKFIRLLPFVFIAFSAHGIIILSDDFDYPDGPITNAPGTIWINHSGGGSNQEALVVSGKLQLTSSRSEDIHAALTNQPYLANTGVTLYASFTINFTALPSSAGTYFAHFNASTSHRCILWASTSGATSGAFRLGIGNTSGATATSGQITNNLALNTTYTVVTRYNVGTGVSTIWLNPTNENDPSVAATDSPSSVTINNFSLRQATGIGTLFVDNLRVGTSFSDVAAATNSPPLIITQPQSQTATEGDDVTFTVEAGGDSPLSYQWQFNGTNLSAATNVILLLTNVTAAHSGSYVVVITNAFGSTNSQPATLTVNPAAQIAFTLLTYNVNGNGVADWSTNSAQVQAIGRQMQYLQPDIITFQEIPYTNTWQMADFVAVYLPGYALATNSGTDGSIRSVILCRFPITRSKSWLARADLKPFGYTNADSSADNFTRDLFEAQISVPGFAQPLHVYTAHLKSDSGTTYADAAAKRAAEAAAITNFFATNLFVLYPTHPYLLTGDMNDSDTNALAIQRLISAPTALRLTNPTNPFTGSINTYSIQGSLDERIDFIFPGGPLSSNIAGSQVFRTDLLTNPPPPLLTNDDKTASDHLPVLMSFANPYTRPFRLLSITRSNPNVTLTWESIPGQSFRLDACADLKSWMSVVSNLTATSGTFSFTTNVAENSEFFRVYRVP